MWSIESVLVVADMEDKEEEEAEEEEEEAVVG
jgi:hypothetical protein